AEQKKAIKSTILECRDILEKDIEQVLINYGIYIDKDWINLRDLRNLTEEQENNRKNIEKAIEKLEKGGYKKDKAVMEYIKEVSYTYLNRLAALRVMEVRGLIDEILMPRSEYGNKSFISSRFYEVAREFCKYETDSGLGYLLNIMFNEISEEIKILFSTEDEYSFVTPSSTSLLKVIELLCSNIDVESWRQDEIIGWIYQYFNDKEKDDVFDRLYNKKQKIKVEDIPAATQLFTPDWIVDWIVDNSLGSLWDGIKQGKRENKKVEDIKLLDPCCGSGHFLVKAFDLFYEMYVEEGIYTKEEIPYKILENNIYGIDIDLRAVQLTSLILFIKVKSSLKENGFDTNTKDKLSVNLVCADSILLNGNRLEELKEKHKNNKTILKMIEIIYEEFKDVRLKGSLIQPERKLFPLFEEYINRIAKKELSKAKRTKKKQTKGQQNLLVEKEEETSFSEYKSQRDFTKEERELMISLDAIYSEAIKANDISRQLFASEAKKSVKLVDIFMKQYDVVVTNPPYMGKKNMNDKLKDFINANYKGYENDLYSAFIIRCLQFLTTNGISGMITQESFMFISSYSKLREYLLDTITVKSLVHLGPFAFEEISGQKVSTCMFIFEKSHVLENSKGVYVKLNDINTSADKKIVLKEIERGKCQQNRFFNVKQTFFKKIEGSPIIYWIPEKLMDILSGAQPLYPNAEAKTGINTGKNAKFVRYWWEIRDECGKKFVPYAKGGGATRFYGAQEHVVWWNPEEMKKHPGCRLMNQDLFFKEGLTFSGVNSQRFAVRYLPEGFIFDSGGSFINCKQIDVYYLLGFLNTKLVNYYLNLFNPTINFKNNDIHRLPFIFEEGIVEQVTDNVKQIIDLKKSFLKYDETDKLFERDYLVEIGEFYLEKSVLHMTKLKLDYLKKIDLNDDIFYKLYGLDNNDIELIENLNEYSDEQIIEQIREFGDINLISKKINAKESRIAYLKLSNKIITDIEKKEVVCNLISYFVGCIFGRWKFNGITISDDGIMPLNSTIYLERDIVERIYECISVSFGEEETDTIIESIEGVLEISIEEYIIKQFFDDHASKYKKRPIYWHICSPKKTFNCYVYYHKFDDDTLYKVKSIYLKQMIDRYEDDLKYYTNQLIEARTKGDKSKEKDFKDKCSDLEAKLEDLNILDKRIMEILPYKPNVDEGVLYNIIPIETILSSPVSTEKEREDYYNEVEKQ
ncbi:MAG TPA: BREX-1 system adenine-specific DNA-methyltransferase PglX, partial [Firmicutes bacterium]|nr:BREX-1 system adenine-specific DNA-methyltransferase PglX [Bacillota bacterium]